MALGLTKTGEQVFAPTNNDGSLREPLLQDAQVWTTEIETAIEDRALLSDLDEAVERVARLGGLGSPRPYDRMTIIAHRGFADQNPENTMLAWTNAIQHGNADALETDISVSSDGFLYCFHDDTVSDLTNGTGTFTDLTSTTINGLAFDKTVGTIYSDLKIPLFSQFLSYARRMGVAVYPEIKNIRTPADIDMIVQAVVDAEMEALCTLSSFNFSDLVYVRGLNSAIGVMFQTSNLTSAENNINYLSGTIGGKTAILVEPGPMIADPARAQFLVNLAKIKNVDFICSTAVSQTTAEFMGALGITKIFSNISLR